MARAEQRPGGDRVVAAETARILGTIEQMEGVDLSSAEQALRAALTDGSFSVRVHAAGALLFTAGKQELRNDCLQAWITSLDSRRGQDRANAMTRLALLADSRPTRKLAAQLLTGPTSLRIQAANTLAAAGKGARAAAATNVASGPLASLAPSPWTLPSRSSAACGSMVQSADAGTVSVWLLSSRVRLPDPRRA